MPKQRVVTKGLTKSYIYINKLRLSLHFKMIFIIRWKQYTACKGLLGWLIKWKHQSLKKKKLLQWFHAHKVNKGNKTEDLCASYTGRSELSCHPWSQVLLCYCLIYSSMPNRYKMIVDDLLWDSVHRKWGMNQPALNCVSLSHR